MASGDAYNQHFDAIISNFNDKVKCVDDTCMWAKSIEAAFFQACEWLHLCARNSITLNPKKFQFAQDTVYFAGLTITETNIQQSTNFLDAISNFPTPTDITSARTWFGLINHGAYAFSMARKMKTSFETIHNILLDRWTRWSISPIQRDHHTRDEGRYTWRSIWHCSYNMPVYWLVCWWYWVLLDAEVLSVFQLEGETMAVVYALHQTHYYVLGCKDLIVATGH